MMGRLITFTGMKMLTRRQFFARMRKLGYSKSRYQLTRIGVTYEKNDDDVMHGKETIQNETIDGDDRKTKCGIKHKGDDARNEGNDDVRVKRTRFADEMRK